MPSATQEAIIGVTSYQTKIFKSLPKQLKSSLPTVEEIKAELSTVNMTGVEIPEKPKKIRKKKSRCRT